jgi:N-acetylmuramoyl-L-alanine amidase
MATYQDLSDLSTYDAKGKKFRPGGIVIHHTGGQTNNPGTIRVLNERGFSSNFVMDRDTNIAHGVAPGSYAAHMHPGGYRMKPPIPPAVIGRNNGNMLGIEVSAIDDSDLLPEQIADVVKWAADMGMTYGFDPGETTFGHGEVNGHKDPMEGYTIANAIRQHHPRTEQQALMSPAPMADQYAPGMGFWAAPSTMGVTARPVPVARVQGLSVSPTMAGAIHPSRGSFAPAGENRWPDETQAARESEKGFSRAEMFALGRDPLFRQLAIEMLTGRMTPNQRVALAHARLQPFTPERMAVDSDYQPLSKERW